MRIVIDICNVCEKEFHKTGNNHLYCSKRCRNKAHRHIWDKWSLNNPESIILHGAKCRAKRDGLEFDITKEDITIPTHCPILGIPIKRNVGSGFHNDSPSLDRIHNAKGYVKDNIRVISNRANLLKCDASLEELELILLDARSHRY